MKNLILITCMAAALVGCQRERNQDGSGTGDTMSEPSGASGGSQQGSGTYTNNASGSQDSQGGASRTNGGSGTSGSPTGNP